mgnify:FL=1
MKKLVIHLPISFQIDRDNFFININFDEFCLGDLFDSSKYLTQKFIQMKKQWWLYSVGGLLLLGFGLSLLGEAILYKFKNDFNWFYWGTAALIVFNSGIALVGEAIVIKGRMVK